MSHRGADYLQVYLVKPSLGMHHRHLPAADKLLEEISLAAWTSALFAHRYHQLAAVTVRIFLPGGYRSIVVDV